MLYTKIIACFFEYYKRKSSFTFNFFFLIIIVYLVRLPTADIYI